MNHYQANPFLLALTCIRKSFHVTLRSFDCEMNSQSMFKITSNPTCVFIDKSFPPNRGFWSRAFFPFRWSIDSSPGPGEPSERSVGARFLHASNYSLVLSGSCRLNLSTESCVALTSLWRNMTGSDSRGQEASIHSRIETARTTVRKRCRIFGRSRNWRMIRRLRALSVPADLFFLVSDVRYGFAHQLMVSMMASASR